MPPVVKMTLAPVVEDLVDPLLGDVALPVSHPLQLRGVVHQELHSHFHFHLLQGEVQDGDLCLGDSPWHLLGGDSAVESIVVHQHAFSGRLAMSLQHVDGLDLVVVADLDGLGCVDDHLREELIIGSDELAGHAGLGAVDQALLTEENLVSSLSPFVSLATGGTPDTALSLKREACQ